jgi:hypothetical protein
MTVIKFSYDIPLHQTMAFEDVYPESLQLELTEKQEIHATPGAIFVWMFIDGELAGESYGIPLAKSDEPIEGLGDLAADEVARGIYCYSNTTLNSFQSRGLGAILKSHWLGFAAGQGFEVVYGHARPGGSQALNAKFGAVFPRDFPDWYGSGEDYRLYRLALR